MMSPTLVLFIALEAVASPLSSQDKHQGSAIPWESDFNKGLDRARKEGKLLLVHFGAEWCTWCRKMDAETFSDPRVAAACGKGLVPVAVDVDKQKDLVKRYLVERVPTAVVILPDGELVEALDGFVVAKEFCAWVESWKAAFARLGDAQARVAKNPGDREAACRQAEALLRLNQPGRAAKAIESALALLPDGGAATPDERKAKAELLVHLGDASLDLLESPRKLLEIAGRIDAADPGGALGFQVHSVFLRAAADDVLSHELEEEALELGRAGKKGPAAKRKSDARTLRAGVLSRLEECLTKYPDSSRADAVLLWTGHLALEVREDRETARRHFKRVVEQYPDSDFADEARQRLKDLGGEARKSDRKEK